jgi:hypothetical protein
VPTKLRHLLQHLLRAPHTATPSAPPRKRRFGWYPTNIRMAFLTMQCIAEPKIGHTIEKHFVEQDEEDDDGGTGPEDPTAHLHRQARKLQRGIPVDRLTTHLLTCPKR